MLGIIRKSLYLQDRHPWPQTSLLPLGFLEKSFLFVSRCFLSYAATCASFLLHCTPHYSRSHFWLHLCAWNTYSLFLQWWVGLTLGSGRGKVVQNSLFPCAERKGRFCFIKRQHWGLGDGPHFGVCYILTRPKDLHLSLATCCDSGSDPLSGASLMDWQGLGGRSGFAYFHLFSNNLAFQYLGGGGID